jgi:hypothetical protein
MKTHRTLMIGLLATAAFATVGEHDTTGVGPQSRDESSLLGRRGGPGRTDDYGRNAFVLTYPFHDKPMTVTNCGRLCFNGRKMNLSQVFAGRNVGVTQVGDRVWLVTLIHYDLGYFDDETCRLEPIENPFGPKVLPMSPECIVTHVTGIDLKTLARPAGLEPATPGLEDRSYRLFSLWISGNFELLGMPLV